MKHSVRTTFLPLKLQFFADGGAEGSGAPAAGEEKPAAAPQPTPAQGGTATEPHREKPQDIAAAILAAVEAATSKKEKTVVKSMAEQYGLSDQEAQEALNAAKAKKAAQLPPEIQQQIAAATEAANKKLIAAEVKTVGTGMGLLDADIALAAMSMENVKVDDKGAVTGVKEALEALKASKAFLFNATESKPTGAKADVGGRVEKPGASAVTPEQFAKMGYSARLALKQKDPELYEKLVKREE